MLKPKTQAFRLKVMLNKLEAVSNKVVSRCIATFKIDGEDSVFKTTPELRKNTAVFNSEVEFDNFSIYFDQITGLYENKQGVLVLQIETQGTKMKLGEVAVNLGGILNEKKYRIVNTLPLSKCYDKTAKVKLSVDFIPLGPEPRTADKAEKAEKGERREVREVREVVVREGQNNEGGGWRQMNYKSRLAQESNSILQQKLYEYEQKMDNYRLSQAQMQEKLHQQINNKDEQITELTMELNRRNQQIAAANLQNQQLRFRVKEQNDEIVTLKDQIKGLLGMIEGLTKSEDSLKQEVQTLRASIDNQGRTRENKEKYYSQELAKYTARYMESQQQRNQIIFELQSKFKEEMEKKETGYRGVIAVNDKKNAQLVQQLRERIKKLEDELAIGQDLIEKYVQDGKRAEETINVKCKELVQLIKKNEQLLQSEGKAKKAFTDLSNQLQTLNFSYNEVEREVDRMKQQLHAGRRTAEQLKMEIVVANQTIQQQRRSITKFTKELQVHREREYFLTEKYNEEMEIKSINEDNIRGESLYFREEINKIRSQLRIAEERAEEEAGRADEMANSINRLEIELNNRGQTIVRMGEERLSLESEVKSLKNEIQAMEQALMGLKEENLQLSDNLRDKRAALQSDKTLEWSYKIEELQGDISEMVEKFKVEKDAMRQAFKREEGVKREEIAQLVHLLKKAKQETDEARNHSLRRENVVREAERGVQDLRKQLRDKTEQFEELRNQLAVAASHYDQIQKRLRSSEESANARVRQAQAHVHKELSALKKAEQGKAAYQKVVQHLLDFLTRPIQNVLTFQEIPFTDIEQEFANLVNLSLRKHCEERQKTRQQIKRLQTLPIVESRQTKRVDIDRVRSQQRFTSVEIQTYGSKGYSQQFDGWRQRGETQQLRMQNGRLKRQVSQLKVKLRGLQQEVGKAERATDNQRATRSEVKRQLEDVQEQLQKVNFQLKRKEKVIAEFEGELKELQGELITLRNSHSQQTRTPPLSRSEVRMREKEETQSNNRKDIIIRDLQTRLQAKYKEAEEVAGEATRLKNENANLKQSTSLLSNEVKLLESKLKDRVAKMGSMEKEWGQVRDRLEGQLHNQSLRHKQELEALAEELLQVQEQLTYAQRTNEALRLDLEEAERRAKSGRQEGRVSDAKSKREQEMVLNRHKEHIVELQTSIITLKSQMEQMSLRYQELSLKNSSLSQQITRKNTEIEGLTAAIKQHEQKVYELEEQILTVQQQSEGKIIELRQIIQDLQEERLKKQYQMEEFRFTTEGRIMDLEKRLEDSQAATNTFKKT